MKENITWTDRVKNEEISHKFHQVRNILHTLKRTKVN